MDITVDSSFLERLVVSDVSCEALARLKVDSRHIVCVIQVNGFSFYILKQPIAAELRKASELNQEFEYSHKLWQAALNAKANSYCIVPL